MRLELVDKLAAIHGVEGRPEVNKHAVQSLLLVLVCECVYGEEGVAGAKVGREAELLAALLCAASQAPLD